MSNHAKDIAPPPPPPGNQNKAVKVYCGIFFDGTNNHRGQACIGENYRARKKILDDMYEKEKKNAGAIKKGILNFQQSISENKLRTETGYKESTLQSNDQSNVALLEPYYNERSDDGYVCKIYIEGIGTTEDGTNMLIGSGTGTGITGIKAKVSKALSKIPILINSLGIKDGSKIDLFLESFGFSRGAAAARNFVSEVTGKNELPFKSKFEFHSISSITVNYVGLFDTVSSHGLNFEDDVKDLGLNAISEANHVFHICAADEFRENFALTDISSATGKEIFIPGAHSDIGGGYSEGLYSVTLKQEAPALETSVKEFDTYTTAQRLKELGWITDGDNEVEKNYDTTVLGKIEINANIKKGYSFVGLELMKDDANAKRKTFNPIYRYGIPNKLKEMNLKERVKDINTLEDCFKSINKEEYKYLRKHWLHFSSNESLTKVGMAPRRVDGILKRQTTSG